MADIADRGLEQLLRDTLREEVASLPLRVRPEDLVRRAKARHRSYRLPGILAFVAVLLLPISFILTTGGAPPVRELQVPRTQATATALVDGRVLVTGGDSDGRASAEIYDPRTGRSQITGSMSESRSQHTATLLDDGRVLVVGGTGADLYDPASGSFSRLADDIGARYGHSATKLSDGRVLILGGVGAEEVAPVATVFDPATATFVGHAPTSDLLDRLFHTTLPLDDHRVLVLGGRDSALFVTREPAVIYDLDTDGVLTLPFSSKTSGIDPRTAITAASLADGRVLMVVAPRDGPSGLLVLFAFDPTSQSFVRLAEIPSGIATIPVTTPVTLKNGSVLVVTSTSKAGGDLERYEIYRFDPATDEVSLVDSFDGAWDPVLVALPDGGALSISAGLGGPSRSEVQRLDPGAVSRQGVASASPE